MDSKSGFCDRILQFQTRLAERRIDAAVLIHSRDIFYYTSIALPSILLVTPSDYHLYVRQGWSFASKELHIDQQHASEGSPKDAAEKLVNWTKNKGVIGFETDVMTAETYFKWRKMLPDSEFTNLSPIILEQRSKKDGEEIDLVRKACKIADIGHGRVIEALKEGMSEFELAAEIEYAERRAGDEGTFFMRAPNLYLRGIVASGPNLYKWSGVAYSITGMGPSPALPVGPSHRNIERGDVVIVDLGPCFNGYYADESRTYVVGKANPEVVSLFSRLKDVCDQIISALREGVECRQLYHQATTHAKGLHLSEYFLNLGGDRKSRLVGHGLGLEVNEPPFLADHENSTLQEGCVLSIEAHVMHPKGVVKLEDVVLVTRHGAEMLTLSPRKLIEVGG
jgi:Xaa-Pro aminopeptidase